MTLLGPDLAEMLVYKYFTEAARDFTLSLLTLLNMKTDAPEGQKPRNHEEIDGVANAFVILFQNLQLLIFRREDYLQPFQGPLAGQQAVKLFVEWMLLIGTGFGLMGGMLGAAAGQAVARTTDKGVFFLKLPFAVLQTVALFFFWMYMHQEGNTDDGTYNPYTPTPFAGYPKPKSGSPYKLPYADTLGSVYVGQGNQGYWSHNFLNVTQVYAYDFSMSQSDEIIAARPGTVVAFWETVPDDTNPGATNNRTALTVPVAAGPPPPPTLTVANPAVLAPKGQVLITDPATGTSQDVSYTSIVGGVLQGCVWPPGGPAVNYGPSGAGPAAIPAATVSQVAPGWNFVVIRHDLDDALNPAGPISTYDVGPGGLGLTCAVYGHGRTGSVTAAFGRQTRTGLPPATPAIIGTQVKRGMPIMDAGDTGISFHNHLHMHVVPDPGSRYSTFGGVRAPASVTIPFVFSDSDVDDDGVCRHFTFYTSSNQRVLS
jgi:hypothetical protein